MNLNAQESAAAERQRPLPGALHRLIPVFGSLVIGLMARFGSDKIRGHGIPEAIEAILYGESKLSLKVAILKPISSAISIGSGGRSAPKGFPLEEQRGLAHRQFGRQSDRVGGHHILRDGGKSRT